MTKHITRCTYLVRIRTRSIKMHYASIIRYAFFAASSLFYARPNAFDWNFLTSIPSLYATPEENGCGGRLVKIIPTSIRCSSIKIIVRTYVEEFTSTIFFPFFVQIYIIYKTDLSHAPIIFVNFSSAIRKLGKITACIRLVALIGFVFYMWNILVQ